MKKLLLIGLPLLVVITLGTVVGLGFMGIIKLPFLPHKKVVKKGGKETVAAKTPPPVKSAPPKTPVPPPTTKPKVEPPKPDVEAGQKKLAGVWGEMEATALVPIIKDWKDSELAQILVKMDPDKVTELLAELDPVRASALSRAIETAAAKPKPVLKTGV